MSFETQAKREEMQLSKETFSSFFNLLVQMRPIELRNRRQK
jgi:hypothetical protein